MRRVLILTAVLCQSVFGYASYSGWCENGGVKVTVQGLNSPLTFQQSFPNLKQSADGPNVTVYATGTTDKATLYSDNDGTPLNNPFPCSSTGQYQFFSTNSVIDLLFSGSGISAFTRSAIAVTDGCPTNSTCDGSYKTLAAACTAAGTGTLYLTRTWSGLTTQTLACNIEALANGIIKPASGQTVSLSKSFNGTMTQHVDTSAGGNVSFTGPVPYFYPEWFGATGAGAGTCDTVPIQNTVNAAVGRSVILSAQYGVCSPGVFLYPANAGITIRPANATPSVPGSTPQGGLIATTSSPASQVLTVYAYNTNLNNLYIDCNAKAATNGLVSAGGGGGTGAWNSVTAHNCSGDGVLITPASGSNTTVTGGGGSGTSAFTVASGTNNTLAFNAFYCHSIIFAQGTGSQEFHSIASGSGTSWVISGTFTNNQSGNSVSCVGNNDEIQIINLNSNNNGGYGLHSTPQTDANALLILNPNFTSNASGGELWESGSVTQHIGGNYQGDGGPMITLGLTTNTSGPSFWNIGPLIDQEEASPSYTVSTSGTSVTGTGFVTGDKWAGLHATINSVVYTIASVTNSTTMVLTSSAGSQSGVSMSVDYNTIKLNCTNSPQIQSFTKASVIFRGVTGSCGAQSGTATGNFIDNVGRGFWIHTESGYIEQFPGNPGLTSYYDSSYNLMGTIGPGTSGYSQVYSDTSAGTNNAITVTVPFKINLVSGFEIKVLLVNHTLQGGGTNTITITDSSGSTGTKFIASHLNRANNIATAYNLHSIVDLIYNDTGVFLDMSQ